jgi:hypothetical protein
MILQYKKRMKKKSKWTLCNKASTYCGQSVNNALEQAHFKNVAKPMFSGRKRTGFS